MQKTLVNSLSGKYETSTPTDVDTLMLRASEAEAIAETRLTGLGQAMKRWTETIESYRGFQEAVGTAHEKYQSFGATADDAQSKIDAALIEKKNYNNTIALAREIQEQAHAEWIRRGRWSRFWLVANTNGHIHKTTNPLDCSSLFPTTEFFFMPHLSGMTDLEVVELAGTSACTLCFPDAPVDLLNRPSQLEAPEKKAAREAREQAKAEREAKKIAKAIANPDGSRIYSKAHTTYVDTEAECQRLYVDFESEKLAYADGKREIHNPVYWQQRVDDNEMFLAALANKRGTTVEEQRSTLAKKAAAKYKREWK